MRCKLNGHNTPSTKLYLGVVGLLTALVVILLTCTSYFPASRISADKFSQARSFLQQIQGSKRGAFGDFSFVRDGAAYNVVYIHNETIATRLSCPLDHTLACFYSFQPHLPELAHPKHGDLVGREDCTALFNPLPSDRGRSWCIRQGKEPPWLSEEVTSSHRHDVPGSVLLTGQLDGPNPTHQVNLHFLAIWRWMKKHEIIPGRLHMLVDSSDTAWSPGKYGTGLANALGKVQWLPLLEPGLYRYQRVQFSIPGGELFPFDLGRYTIDAGIDLDYLELAETIKMRMGCYPNALLAADVPTKKKEAAPPHGACTMYQRKKPTVIIAQRLEPEARQWVNAHELARQLQADQDLDVKVVSFGKLDFPQQVQAAATADVLVGVTGSDLVNLIFLPPTGAVIEIFPSLNHEALFVPELGNLATLLGKNHFTYAAEGNITVNEGESRLLYRVKSINIAVPDLAALVHNAAHQAWDGSGHEATKCAYQGTSVQCTGNAASRTGSA